MIVYQDEQITLHHADALTMMGTIQGADVLVTDPPYGLDAHLSFGQRGGHRVTGRQDWDEGLAARDAVLSMWWQIDERPAAVFGSPRMLDRAPAYREVPLVWDKGDVVAMGDTGFPWRPTYELIYVAGAGWTGHRSPAVLRVRHDSRAASELGHPTPKPVALMEEIIRKAPPGVIVDPFSGSGATLIAARNLGRQAIGIEVSEDYCRIAARRLANAPTPLFIDMGDA